jgi:hypothetical protein
MSENLNNSSIIEDIDLPLYKYGLIYKQNIDNYLATNKQKILQQFKSYALTAILLIVSILLFIHLKFYKNPKDTIFYYDLFNYLGGLTEYTYAICLLGSLTSLRLIYLFNYSDESLYEWLDIIEVLKGLKSVDSIGLENREEYKLFIRRIKLFKFLVEISLKFFFYLSFFILITIAFLVFDTTQSIFYGILYAMFHWLWMNYSFGVQLYSFLFYFIICYYFRLRFKLLNNNISRNSKLSVAELTAKIIREHNNICNDILKYDKFWKRFYFVVTYTIIPINLMFLQQILFDDIILTAILLASMVVIIFIFCHIILNLISAAINTNASKSHKFLFKFQIKFLSSINVRQRIKVLIIKDLNKDLNKLFNCVYYS